MSVFQDKPGLDDAINMQPPETGDAVCIIASGSWNFILNFVDQ